jgi:hypothetical protein
MPVFERMSQSRVDLEGINSRSPAGFRLRPDTIGNLAVKKDRSIAGNGIQTRLRLSA